MGIDPSLLGDAVAAEGRLIEAEHAVAVARADFHRAVRRLQLGGASMREAAEALGLSHQRVHQIVESAGGSRRWRKPAQEADACACSFCGRRRRRSKEMVAGPGVFVCRPCVAVISGVLGGGAPAVTPIATLEQVEAGTRRARCSFCGKRPHQVGGLARARGSAGQPGQPAKRKVAGDVHICTDCVALCQEIFAEQLS
jgi:hypothetical protein